MARQGPDGSTVAHSSSIALLQERFRQLQRAKEIREERELLRKTLAESERVVNIPATGYEAKELSFQSGFALPHYKLPPHEPQCSMYLQPNLQRKHANYLQVSDETQLSGNMCSSSVAVMRRTNNYNDSDVDTSLHL